MSCDILVVIQYLLHATQQVPHYGHVCDGVQNWTKVGWPVMDGSAAGPREENGWENRKLCVTKMNGYTHVTSPLIGFAL
jgi:hypothetical protein